MLCGVRAVNDLWPTTASSEPEVIFPRLYSVSLVLCVSRVTKGGARCIPLWSMDGPRERERESVLVNALSRPQRALQALREPCISPFAYTVTKTPFSFFLLRLLLLQKTPVALQLGGSSSQPKKSKLFFLSPGRKRERGRTGHSHMEKKGMRLLLDAFVPYGYAGGPFTI